MWKDIELLALDHILGENAMKTKLQQIQNFHRSTALRTQGKTNINPKSIKSTSSQELARVNVFFFGPIQRHFQKSGTGTIDPQLNELIRQSQVILQINESFLDELEKRLGKEISANYNISDIVQKYAPQFKKYTGYLDVQQSATEAYQKLAARCPDITEESIRLQKESKTFVNFDSLSITPIQRVPRYIMLIKEILKNTPQENENRQGLEKCMDLLKETAKFMDDHVKEGHEYIYCNC
ncbi:MAG: hypothetical protein EZS28_020399, partial [Streblomastix strix]